MNKVTAFVTLASCVGLGSVVWAQSHTKRAPSASAGEVSRGPTLDLDACVAWVKANISPSVAPATGGPVADLQGFIYGTDARNTPKPVPKLMLFGGSDHKTYLGCLNCAGEVRDSVWNQNGPHGPSRLVASDSIWDRFGQYGDEYGSFSPWASFASSPPVIVDEAGGYHGHFTVSTYDSERSRLPEVRFLLNVIATVRASR